MLTLYTVLTLQTERLIHLELADLAINQPYLEPGWKPFIKGPGKGKMQQRPHLALGKSSDDGTSSGKNGRNPSPSKPGKKKAPFVVNGIGNGGGDGPCKDCKLHAPFLFQRILIFRQVAPSIKRFLLSRG
jgi:hypothetical protein